jgi:hypothetical protein
MAGGRAGLPNYHGSVDNEPNTSVATEWNNSFTCKRTRTRTQCDLSRRLSWIIPTVMAERHRLGANCMPYGVEANNKMLTWCYPFAVNESLHYSTDLVNKVLHRHTDLLGFHAVSNLCHGLIFLVIHSSSSPSSFRMITPAIGYVNNANLAC